jgi:teichuronic acid biosynthesis glycosyltransferase TuaG
MPAYNAAAYIAEAIESVITQKFMDWELLVVNDGSTDGTLKLVQNYSADKRIKLISQDNKGLGAARNVGIRAASGSWICFLDADDLWLNHKLKVQHQFILAHGEVDVLFSDGYTFDQAIKFRLNYHFLVAKGWHTGAGMYKLEFSGNCIPVLSACIKREWCEKVGPQYERLTGAEDWDYWLRLAAGGAVFYGLDERLFVYRVHAAGMSADLLPQQTASGLILIKNYNRQLLSDEIIKTFFTNLITLQRKLIRAGQLIAADQIAHFLEQNYPGRYFRVLKNFLGINTAILLCSVKFTFTLTGSSIKKWIKKLLLALTQLLFFKPYQLYNRHKHNLTIQYYRWQLGKRLETRGYFYMSPKANLNILARGAKMITYGLHINDYSQITMDRDSSYLLTGSNVIINRFCNLVIWEGSLIMGNNVTFNNYCSINCMERIEIGDDTLFGEGVRIYDHNHQYKTAGIPFNRQGMTTGKIKIGHNCWIGSNTIILQNVTIGDNCIVGANNLIYKSVPDNTIIKAKAMEIIDSFHSNND